LLRRILPGSARTTTIPLLRLRMRAYPPAELGRGANFSGAAVAGAVGTNLGSDLPVGCVTPAVMLHSVPRREAIIRCQIRETVAWTSAAEPRGMGWARPIPARRAAMPAANLFDLNCAPREPKYTAGFLVEFATFRDKTTLPSDAER
jgi:hypothetical protein